MAVNDENYKIKFMKRCSVCHVWMPQLAFHRDRSYKDGRSHRCRACQARRHAWWRQRTYGTVQEARKA